MANFDFPSNNDIVDTSNGNATMAWLQWFNRIHTIASSLQQSGTTADRPAKLLWNGRRYFDESLGIPVWYFNGNWVNASGATV